MDLKYRRGFRSKTFFYGILVICVWGLCFVATSNRVIAQDEQAEQPAVNPLQNFLKKFLNPNNPAPAPADDIDEEQEPSEPIDSSVPFVREHKMILDNAKTRVQLGQWPEAIKIYQTMLDSSANSIVQGSDGEYRSVRWEIQRQIAQLPEVAREMYLQTYSGLARRMLDDAYESSDMNHVREVAEKYFLTDAGQAAANRIASIHVDRGEFAIAALWYERLVNAGGELTRDPLWRFKVESVYEQAGLRNGEERPWEAMTKVEEQGLNRRLPGDSLEAVRKAWSTVGDFFNPPLEDWLYPGGAAHRSGQAAGTLPLLLSVWSQPTTEHPQILDQMEQLIDDLEVSQVPVIPAMQPISVKGKIIFRTFEGLCVVDGESGQILWETRDDISPAMLLTTTSQSARQFLQQRGVVIKVNGVAVNPYFGYQAEQHPLTNFLFRNAVHGTVSSDGQAVYSIEENALLSNQSAYNYYSNRSLADNDPYHRDWGTNRLSSYDIETGRQLWSIGGSRVAETIDSPLAGTFFLGTPLIEAGDLFILGEQEGAIRMHCLRAEDGQLQWSQVIAYTEVPMDRDASRRWWPAQIALSGGVLVCPTNIGLLVGVDRASHEILWVSRYADKTQNDQNSIQMRRGGYVMTNPGTIKDRWFPTPPMIINQTVILAPPEVQMLAGYRLSDGKELWRINNESGGLYPAGSFNGELIVVNRAGLVGYDVKTGRKLWERNFSDYADANNGDLLLPSGRGLVSEDRFLIPMGGKEIWYFDLKERKFTGRAGLGEENLTLGNLIMSRGRLVSAAPDRVVQFDPKEDVEREINTRLALDKKDFRALSKQAQILSLEKDYDQSLATLDQIDASALDGQEKQFYRQQMQDVLFGLVEQDSDRQEEYLKLLAEYVKSESDQQRYLRLLAQAQIETRQFAGAFESYTQLSQFGDRKLVRDHGHPSLLVRQDVWLNARLQELWSESTGEVSSQISQFVSEASWDAIQSKDREQLLKVIRLYGFHPDTIDVYLAVVELGIDEQNFALSEYALKCLGQFDDPCIRASAIAGRADLLREFGLPEDARYMGAKLSEFDQDLVLLDGLTVQDWLEEQEVSNDEQPHSNITSHWSDEEFEVSHMGISQWNQQRGTINLDAGKAPYFQQHRFQYAQQQPRVTVFNNRTDEVTWSIPIQQMEQAQAATVLPIRVRGHVMTLYSRGLVQCYSLPDRRLLWAHPVSRQSGAVGVTNAGKQPMSSLQKAKSAASRFRLNQNRNVYGPLVLNTDTTVYYFGRNEFIAADVLNGEIRWIRRGIPRGAMIYGDDTQLCIAPPALSQAVLVDARDGRTLESKDLEKLLSNGIAITGETVITVDRNEPAAAFSRQFGSEHTTHQIQKTHVVEGRSLRTKETIWSLQIDENEYVGQIDDDRFVIVELNGLAHLHDSHTGDLLQTIRIAELNGELAKLQELFMFMDGPRLYLVGNKSTNHSTYLNIYSQRVNGTIFCLDLEQEELAWSYETEKLNLVLEEIDQLPVLVLAGTKHEQKHMLYVGTFHVTILDKITGKVIIEEELLNQNQVQRITWSEHDKQISLHAYNSVITLQPKRNMAKNEPKAE
ncbi:MAG TPA: hypothetical protein DD473_23475 [Planctomycetaceae bacterium]|nr:hypothetical protein [Planctomycetaceae bacterium]